jgi:hypothetical protein
MKGQTPQPTPAEEAKWRGQFEALGREAVRLAIARGQGFVPERKRELAILWLREKEIEAEKRERKAHWYAKWTLDAAIAAAIIGFITLLAMLTGAHL